jgi:AraC-like DNA-binding protein
MDYREYTPAPDLAPFVRSFWTLSGVSEPGAAERLLPDGRLELAIHLGDPFDRLIAPEVRERQHRALFIGQQDAPVLLEPSGSVSVFGVCFHPDGASAFARWPQHETAGRILPLEDVWGAAARRLEEAIRNAASHADRITIAGDFLRARMRAGQVDHRLRAAVDLIQREPWHRMAAIAAQTGASVRHLERAFLDRVGCPPKTLARITRFQRVLSLREQRPQWGWARVAVESGYYDQAHLIADFRRFSGSTPALHQDDLTAMERLFLSRQR